MNPNSIAYPLLRLVIRSFFVLSLIALLLPSGSVAAVARQQADPPPLTLPNGVAAGDVTQNSVVLWTRSTEPGVLIFTTPNGGRVVMHVSDPAIPRKVIITGLAPDTEYTYGVLNAAAERDFGQFKTPAAVGEHVGLRFGAGGDWSGNRLVYPAVANAVGRNLDFFVALGDTIYADSPSPAFPNGSAYMLSQYRLKHEEIYSTYAGLNTFAELRAGTAVFATFDDHEIGNDFAGGSLAIDDIHFEETSGLVNDTQQFEDGLQAFHEYYPIGEEIYGSVDDDGRMSDERKFYRYRTFGSDGALFVLDARSFRDPPIAGPGSAPEELSLFLANLYTPGRTMLGVQQLADLKRDLLDSQAKGITWKFVAIPEPIQNLGQYKKVDRYEGYAAERSELLKFIHENQISNVVFVAADVHGTVVNNLVYREAWESPLVYVDAFEVTTGAVAQTTYGPGVVKTVTSWGVISPSQQEEYTNLPVQFDMDSVPDDKDDYVKQILNRSLAFSGDDPIGLEDSSIDATLLQGDYIAVHTNGWTEFEVEPDSQKLTVTTFGIPPYSAADAQENLDEIVALQPEIVSQFEVMPKSVGSSAPPMPEHVFVPAVLGE